MADGWTTLGLLRDGALFETRDGVRAVKSEYRTFSGGSQCDCYLIASGEAAHFPKGDAEPVREIPLDYLLASVADLRQESSAYQRGLSDGAAGVLQPDGKACQYDGCGLAATHVAAGRQFGRPDGGHPGPGCYCAAHAERVADEGAPEYGECCPNCGCLFGVG
jgi:hypothetical protein